MYLGKRVVVEPVMGKEKRESLIQWKKDLTKKTQPSKNMSVAPIILNRQRIAFSSSLSQPLFAEDANGL